MWPFSLSKHVWVIVVSAALLNYMLWNLSGEWDKNVPPLWWKSHHPKKSANKENISFNDWTVLKWKIMLYLGAFLHSMSEEFSYCVTTSYAAGRWKKETCFICWGISGEDYRYFLTTAEVLIFIVALMSMTFTLHVPGLHASHGLVQRSGVKCQ